MRNGYNILSSVDVHFKSCNGVLRCEIEETKHWIVLERLNLCWSKLPFLDESGETCTLLS